MPNDHAFSSPAGFGADTLSTGTQVCSCGSGISAAQCCALDGANALPAAVEPEPATLEALYAARKGDIESAAALCIALLEQTPTLLPALHLLYLIRRDQGVTDAALVLARRLARLAPKDSGMALELARMFFAKRRWVEAERQARHALRLAPRSPEAHEALATAFSERKDFAAAEYHLRQALACGEGPQFRVKLALAQNLTMQGALDQARALIEHVLAVTPGHVPALVQMAQLESYAGREDEAAKFLGRAQSAAPPSPARRSPALLEAQARHAYDTGDFSRALVVLEEAASVQPLSAGTVLMKGRALDRLGRHDEAFAAYEAAQAIEYDEAEAKGHLAWIENSSAHAKKFFVRGMMQSLPRADAPSGKKPIFVLGFARSGTTLVEQSFAMHPLVSAGGEMQSLRLVVRDAQRLLHSSLPYPNALTELWMGDKRHGLNVLRDVYLADAGQHYGIAGSEKPFFTDKMIFNEMHLALISLILPQAPVIHMIRHPLDVVLSVFSHQLSGGIRSRMTLEDTARHYAALMDLVAHYRAQDCAGRYLAVRHEDFVADQASEMARMLEFAGLPFDEACLRFSENTRYVRTLSFGQVRKPLNSDGVFRYRHYRRQLAPIYPILAPVIERLGYAIE